MAPDSSSLYFFVGIGLLLAGLCGVLGGTLGFIIGRRSRSNNGGRASSPNLKAIKHLQQLTKDIQKVRGFKIRAESHPKSELEPLIQTINHMLKQLQDNENQIQDMTISLQEQHDALAAQKKIHLDRNANLQKMFAGASHDLRQPLQAMVIFIGALKDSANPGQMPLVLKLEQVVDNLDHMFSDLLDLSKLEARMKRIPKQKIDIYPLLVNIYDEFEALANEKKIELRLYNRHASVYSNPSMLERIIRNMISNAIRYTRTGGVLIGIRQRQDEVWIEVWDTGRGIPEEKMSEIFNEFVQIKEDPSESNKGVGLGLFIVKRLAQLLDHSIFVKSKIHQGTLFRIAVPAHKTVIARSVNLLPSSDDDLQQSSSTHLAPINVTQLLPNDSLCVVMIDDDASVRISLRALLESWNLHVVDVGSIAEAMQVLPRLDVPVDIVVSDFQLSDQETGIEAVQAVRQHCGDKLPAILVTGAVDEAILSRIKDSGIPMLKKPVKPAKLRALINTLTQKMKRSK